MTRKKVKLAFISNDSARKATYKKRKRGLLKKMDELTTLCDIKACAILYSPYDAKPVVWPSPSGAREVVANFKRLPEMEKMKKMVNQEEFLRQRISKASEQLKRQQKENREKEVTQAMYQCLTGERSIQNMNLLDLSDLSYVIDQNLNEISKRIQSLKKEGKHSVSQPAPQSATKLTLQQEGAPNQVGLGIQNSQAQKPSVNMMEMNQGMQGQAWYMDLMNIQAQNEHNYMPSFGGSSSGDHNMPSFLDFHQHNFTNLWSNAFFP